MTRATGVAGALPLLFYSAPFLTFGFPSPALAEDTAINIQQLAPVPGSAFTVLVDAAAPGHLRAGFALFAHYAQRPLSLSDPNGDRSDLLTQQTQVDLLASLGIGRSFQLGLGVPFTVAQQVDPDAPSFFSVPGQAPGDVRLLAKWRAFAPTRGPSVALAATVTLPTGDEAALQGHASVTGSPLAVVDWQVHERLEAGLNLGALLRAPEQLFDFQVGHELVYGAGLRYAVVPDRLDVLGELFGRYGITGSETAGATPLELALGLKLRLGDHAVTLGGGPGLTHGYGTPVFRAYVGYSWSMRGADARDRDRDGLVDAADKCPTDAEDRDTFQDDDGCPDPDNDQDSVPDSSDRCPAEAEDVDRFEDQDGCPDPDNDRDDIADSSDRCPDQAETKNRVEDSDGCPEPDTDGDAIVDPLDKCPKQPETVNGLDDTDGCPEPDADGDGVVDARDKCPKKAETRNGYQDADGCPEADTDGDSFIDPVDKCPKQPETANGFKDDDGCPDSLSGEEERTRKQFEVEVYFDTAEASIKPESFAVLQQAAKYLKDTPGLTLVRIEGHTDNVGDDALNQSLSERRAGAVKAHMVALGIDDGRLEAVGYGERDAAADNATEEGRQKNRRVLFRFLKREVRGAVHEK